MFVIVSEKKTVYNNEKIEKIIIFFLKLQAKITYHEFNDNFYFV